MTWQAYQEEAADFFRSLGMQARTNVRIKGVRTKHDVDVLVQSQHAGFQVQWVVECKLWKFPVTKLHVLALREIVHDTGSDRGILLSNSGFQSGALEAAMLTNVQVTSLESVQAESENQVYAQRLIDIYDRHKKCAEAYWDISKEDRIRLGLRQEYSHGYTGAFAIAVIEAILAKAPSGRYPFELTDIWSLRLPERDRTIASAKRAVEVASALLEELEQRLEMATKALKS